MPVKTPEASIALAPSSLPIVASKAQLSSKDLENLLIGEFAIQRGENQRGAQALFAAAKSTKDLQTAMRASYLAQFSEDSTLLFESSSLWAELAPKDPSPWEFIAQSQLQQDDPHAALEAIGRQLNLGGGEGLHRLAPMSLSLPRKSQLVFLEGLENLITQHPHSKHLNFALALLNQHFNHPEEAFLYAKQALVLDEEYVQAQLMYAEFLLLKNDAEAADAYLNQYTLALGSAPSALIVFHAQILTQLEDFNKAHHYFDELISRYPRRLGYQYSAGILAYQSENYESAAIHLNDVIRLDPNYDGAYYYLGLTALKQGHEQGAANFLAQVLRGPNRLSAMALRLELEPPELTNHSDYFQKLRQTHQDLTADIYVLEAGHLRDSQHFDLAKKAYQKALTKHPNYTPLLYGYALLCQTMMELDTSEQLLKKIIAIEPDHVNALNALGYSYAEQGIRLKEAKQLIEKALTLAPESPAIIDSLGWVNYRLGHLREALTLLTKAYDMMPIAEIAAHLGEVKWALGDLEGAFKVWNRALEAEPDNALIKQAILDSQNEFQKD